MDKADIVRMPKLELHQHVDGSIRPELLVKLAKKHGIKLPTYNVHGLAKKCTINGDLSSEELFERFAWSIAVMRTPEGLEEVFFDQALELAKQKVVYAELRFAPGYHSVYPPKFYDPQKYESEPFVPMSLDDTVQSALKALERAKNQTGYEVNLTLSIPRECAEEYGMQSAQEIAKLAVRHQDKGVVALDLACDETRHPASTYARVFQSTVGTKIRRDPHAGEMGSEEYKMANIQVAVKKLIANGLGHALPLWKDDEYVSHVKFLGVRIERNPWKSPVRGEEEDGTDRLLKRGVKISICSDDPVLMGQDLSGCIADYANRYGWGETELVALQRNALDSAFYTGPEQQARVRELVMRN